MANGPWRDTSTPPQNMPRYATPNDPRIRQVSGQLHTDQTRADAYEQPYPATTQYGQYPPSAMPPIQAPPAQFAPQPVSSNDLESLKRDVANVIAHMKSAWESAPLDTRIQHQLKALLDLERVLNTQTIPPQQLQAIRAQVDSMTPAPAPAPVPAPMPAYAPPVSITPQPYIQTPQHNLAAALPPASTPINLAQLLANVRPAIPQTSTPVNAPLNLADMLRRVSTPQASSTPTPMAPFYPPPQPTVTPTPPAPVPAPTTNLAQLLAQVNRPAAPPAPQPPLLSHLLPQQQGTGPPPVAPEWLLNSLKGLPLLSTGGPLPQSGPAVSTPITRPASGSVSSPDKVELTTASMKQ